MTDNLLASSVLAVRKGSPVISSVVSTYCIFVTLFVNENSCQGVFYDIDVCWYINHVSLRFLVLTHSVLLICPFVSVCRVLLQMLFYCVLSVTLCNYVPDSKVPILRPDVNYFPCTKMNSLIQREDQNRVNWVRLLGFIFYFVHVVSVLRTVEGVN